MPSPFDITTATNTVTLDNNRQGIAVFTVKNNLRRRVHAGLQVTTQPPNALKWLTLVPADGSTDPANVRDFPIDSTQQIQIKIAVPADAPAGSYSLKLAVADEINPDDNFSTSTDVLFTVPAIVPPPPPKPFPVWIIPVVLISIVVIAIIVIVATRNPPPPPPPTVTPTPTLPNLVAGNASLNPPQPFCSQPFTIRLDVANLGAAATSGSGLVTASDSLGGPGGPIIATTNGTFPVIQPGQTVPVVMSMVLNIAGNQQHNLTLTIDPNNQIPETNETDNQRVISFVLIPFPLLGC